MPESVMKFIRIIEKITGSFWHWKGRRIRPLHKNAVRNVRILLFLSFFILLVAPMLLVFNPSDWKMLVIMFSSIAIASFFILRSLQEKILVEYYDRLMQKQRIERVIFDNGLVDIEKDGKKTSVTYHPKVYYQKDDEKIIVSFPLDGKNQQKHLDIEKDLEVSLYASVTDTNQTYGYIHYEFVYNMITQRITIDDIIMEDGKLRLMKNLYWEIDDLPHMLIAGGTGGGKTYFVFALIEAFIKGGAEIIICDPKKSDLSDLGDVMPNVYNSTGQMIKALREFYQGMDKFYEDVKSFKNYKTGKNYAYYGLPPKVLVFDEFVAFYGALDFKEKGEVDKYLNQLALLGRQAGYFLIIACQRPDAQNFPPGVRDQLLCRISLGKLYPVGYSMVFGDVDKVFLSKKITGRGYCDTGKGIIMEFYSPLVPEGHDFVASIKTLYLSRVMK